MYILCTAISPSLHSLADFAAVGAGCLGEVSVAVGNVLVVPFVAAAIMAGSQEYKEKHVK